MKQKLSADVNGALLRRMLNPSGESVVVWGFLRGREMVMATSGKGCEYRGPWFNEPVSFGSKWRKIQE
jgi:hypothetical protein